MTAEIAVLNSQAVALAADSAVTVSDGTNRAPKIYNTVNKLFTLSKHEPVGVMIYGSAELGGLPVETAVKVFRDQLGQKAFGSLQEYADSFLEFLGTSALLFPQERQDRFVRLGSLRFLSRVKEDLDRRVRTRIEAEGEISEGDLKDELTTLLGQHREAVEREELLTSADPTDVQSVSAAHSEVIGSATNEVFEQVLFRRPARSSKGTGFSNLAQHSLGRIRLRNGIRRAGHERCLPDARLARRPRCRSWQATPPASRDHRRAR